MKQLTSVHVDDQRRPCASISKSWVREEGRLQPGTFLLPHGGHRRTRRHGAAAGALRQPGGQSLPADVGPCVPARAMFFTDDAQADYEGMKARGAEFTMPPTDGSFQDRHAERHLRQSQSGHAAEALVSQTFSRIRDANMSDRPCHRVTPMGTACTIEGRTHS